MATLVERARQVISAENDDFFNADTILFYLNKAQRKVTSYMVNQESALLKGENERKSLRALDGLRGYTDVDVGTLTVAAKGSYFSTEVTFPTGTNQFMFLRYSDRTVLRELNTFDLSQLEWGNLVPTQFEGYYYVTSDGTDNVFEIFLHEDLSGEITPPVIRVYYVSTPTDLTLTSESLVEMPEQLENAVIYGAAMMMVMQESVKDPQTQSQIFGQLYQEEIQANTY